MIKSRSLLTDGAWIAALQGLSAVGQLLGMRLLTEVVSPSVFGEVSLWVGAIALVSAAMANPTMQALLRFYPEFHEKREGLLVKSAVRAQLVKLGKIALPVLAVALVYAFSTGNASIPDLVILLALVVVDVARMTSVAYLNALRAFKPAGIWALIEAWGRPLLAYILVETFGVDATWVLLAYLLVSLFALGLMHRYVPVDPELTASVESNFIDGELSRRFWKYSIPLLPLGLIGWVSGMADRYLIGYLLTPADVGLYVAVYGLASRPMAIFGGIVETAIRPAYQHAVIAGDHTLEKECLIKWTRLVFVGAFFAVLTVGLGHEFVAGALLGSEYRNASGLLPWVVGGYGLLILSHVANRVCYANEATVRVFYTECAGALFAVFVGFFCIDSYGLFGAAVAVPVYYGMQLALSYGMAWRWVFRK